MGVSSSKTLCLHSWNNSFNSRGRANRKDPKLPFPSTPPQYTFHTPPPHFPLISVGAAPANTFHLSGMFIISVGLAKRISLKNPAVMQKNFITALPFQHEAGLLLAARSTRCQGLWQAGVNAVVLPAP